MAARTHNDRTTVQAVWNAGGAQPPAGVPVDYGAVVWREAVPIEGPALVF